MGLVYLRARYYHPSMGRFLTRDTWEGNYQRPQSLNRWNYVEGNPINLTDPSGHCPLLGIDCIVIGGTILIIGGAVLAFHILYNTDDFVRAVEDLRFGCPDIEVKPGVKRVRDAFGRFGDEVDIGMDFYPFPLPNPAPNPQPAPEPNPRSNPPKLTETPKPKDKHIALGLLFTDKGDAPLGSFAAKLNLALNPQNVYVYLSDAWFREGLTDVSVPFYDFQRAFDQASKRAKHIHYTLEGIDENSKGIKNPRDWADTYGAPGDFSNQPWAAHELYLIMNNPTLCQKTSFYEGGNIVPSSSAKMNICGIE